MIELNQRQLEKINLIIKRLKTDEKIPWKSYANNESAFCFETERYSSAKIFKQNKTFKFEIYNDDQRIIYSEESNDENGDLAKIFKTAKEANDHQIEIFFDNLIKDIESLDKKTKPEIKKEKRILEQIQDDIEKRKDEKIEYLRLKEKYDKPKPNLLTRIKNYFCGE